jgi:hypothetical protein
MRPTDLGDVPPPVQPGSPVRHARLRPEYAALYSGLDPGAGYPAASLAAYFRSWLSRHPGPQHRGAPLRGLETAHFEFRGGVPRETPWISGQSADERQM